MVAQHELVDATRSFRAVFDASADGILLSDTDSLTVVEANPAACRMFGYDHDELIGLGWRNSSSTVAPRPRATAKPTRAHGR